MKKSTKAFEAALQVTLTAMSAKEHSVTDAYADSVCGFFEKVFNKLDELERSTWAN